MRMRCVRPLASLMILILALGCGPSLDLRGTWIGFRDLKAAEGADPSMVRTLSKVELKIDGMGKFRLFAGQLPTSGRVRQSGGKAFLEVERVAGEEIARQPQEVQERYGTLEVTPQHDGTLLFSEPKAGVPPVILKREG